MFWMVYCEWQCEMDERPHAPIPTMLKITVLSSNMPFYSLKIRFKQKQVTTDGGKGKDW